MCQINSEPFKLAEKDIVCYKVLEKTCNPEVFNSPYMCTKYSLGKKFRIGVDDNLFHDDRDEIVGNWPYLGRISDGFYHFIMDKEGATRLAKVLSEHYENHVVGECTIPAGTLCSEGDFETMVIDQEFTFPSICAKEFTINKIL